MRVSASIRLLRLTALLCLTALPALPYAKFQGYAQKGGVTVTINAGLSSAPVKFQASYPQSTVTIRNSSDNSTATIYSDNAGTAKSNPFVADLTGFWSFYASDGIGVNDCGVTLCGTYSVTFSGVGVSSPFTLSGLNTLDPAVVEILPIAVTSYGAIGNFGAGGAHDDTVAIRAAIAAACAQPSARLVRFPPPLANGYWSSTTIVAPCGSITLDFTNQAKWIYTGTGAAFDTNGFSDITFDSPSLGSPGSIANQVGIWVNGSNSIKIRDGFIGGFGVRPTITAISSCTNAATTVCTTATAPPNGPILTGGFGASAGDPWAVMNGLFTATHLTATTFSIALDTTTFGALTGAPSWGTTDASGCAVKLTGDSLSFEYSWMKAEVWGEGICSTATTDVMNVNNSTFGVAFGHGSGFALDVSGSIGAGQIIFDHLNIVTPGGAGKIGPNAGQVVFKNVQYEALNVNPPLMNELSTAWFLDSALRYQFEHNNIDLHNTGNYCLYPANWSGPGPSSNSCSDYNVAQIATVGVGFATFKDNVNSSLLPGYDNPNYLGIEQIAYLNGYRSWGSQWAQAPSHWRIPYVPYNNDTTISAAITTAGATSMAVTSATGMVSGQIRYIDAEQVLLGTPSGTTIPISRGYNGTTATTHLINAPVMVGPGSMLLLSATVGGNSMFMGMGVDGGFGYLKCRQKAGNVYVPVPCYMDVLHVESTDPADVNTKVVVKATGSQSDNLLETQSSAGTIKTSIDKDGILQALTGLPIFANNAAAIAGGVAVGRLYRTGANPDPVMVVH